MAPNFKGDVVEGLLQHTPEYFSSWLTQGYPAYVLNKYAKEEWNASN